MMDKIQKIYPFLCDNPFDLDTEKYLKFLAPLAYNQSINVLFKHFYSFLFTQKCVLMFVNVCVACQNEKKEMIANEPRTAMLLFVHSIKFYAKLCVPFQTMLESTRIYEQALIKNGQVDEFYRLVCDFLFSSLSTNAECLQKAIEPIASHPHPHPHTSNTHISKQIYLRKFYLSLFAHLASIRYSSNLVKLDEVFIAHLANIKTCFDPSVDHFVSHAPLSDQERAELQFGTDVIELVQIVLKFAHQFKKKPSSSSSSSSSTTTPSRRTSGDKSVEMALDKQLRRLFPAAARLNAFYFYSLLNQLVEFFTSCMSVYLNDPALAARYLQDPLVEMLASLACNYVDNLKVSFIYFFLSFSRCQLNATISNCI